MIVASSEEDWRHLEMQLVSQGFQKAQDLPDGELFVKPKRLGPVEIFAIVFGLFCFLLPGVMYLMMWSRRGPETLLLRRGYTNAPNGPRR